jgi:hypothetical protein
LLPAGPLLIQNNMVNGNGGEQDDGIHAKNAHIEGNIIADNFQTGVDLESGLVLGNTITGNGGLGLFAGSSVGYGNNTFSANANTVVGGFELHPNVCNGAAC